MNINTRTRRIADDILEELARRLPIPERSTVWRAQLAREVERVIERHLQEIEKEQIP